MNLLTLAIQTIVMLSQQQILHKMDKDTGYIFTLKMVNKDNNKLYYAHIIITERPFVFILVSQEPNWREIDSNEWSHAVNTSNHDECWKSSGFSYLENIWDRMEFNRLEFHTGNFGLRLYEEVCVTKEPDGNYLYKLLNVRSYQ